MMLSSSTVTALELLELLIFTALREMLEAHFPSSKPSEYTSKSPHSASFCVSGLEMCSVNASEADGGFEHNKTLWGFQKTQSPHIWGSNLHLRLLLAQWSIHVPTATSMSSGLHVFVELILNMSKCEWNGKGDPEGLPEPTLRWKLFMGPFYSSMMTFQFTGKSTEAPQGGVNMPLSTSTVQNE